MAVAILMWHAFAKRIWSWRLDERSRIRIRPQPVNFPFHRHFFGRGSQPWKMVHLFISLTKKQMVKSCRQPLFILLPAAKSTHSMTSQRSVRHTSWGSRSGAPQLIKHSNQHVSAKPKEQNHFTGRSITQFWTGVDEIPETSNFWHETL